MKSTYSSAGGNDCVEMQAIADGRIAVRDSKTPELGAYLFTLASWTSFLEEVKSGGL